MAVITISRHFGAGGRTLGVLIAKRLNYALIDDEIIQMVAKKAKVTTNFVESIEKEAGGRLSKFISGLVSKRFIDRILVDESRGYLDEEVYIDLLRDIIKKIANEGNCVILGRGGQYILKGEPDVYHILLVADKEFRIKFMEEHYDLLPTQAKNVVSSWDKRRRNLFRKFGKEDYDQPVHYHAVINTGLLKDMEKAADIVCAMVQGKA